MAQWIVLWENLTGNHSLDGGKVYWPTMKIQWCSSNPGRVSYLKNSMCVSECDCKGRGKIDWETMLLFS